MRKHWPGRLALLVCLTLAGCSGTTPDAEGPPREEPEPRLGGKTDLDAAAWLALPRAELARLCEEWTETVARQREGIRNEPMAVTLLPKLLPPFTVPGLSQAAFSPEAGFSLPPYAAAGKADPGLALHLARLGDAEAAARLVAPGDAATRGRLAALAYEKNYPVEWTRLVGLALISSHLKLSLGDVDGATQIVHLHVQLQALLDARAAAGPLGTALLPWGKRALSAAAETWRSPRFKHVELAGDLDKALAAWGDAPAPTPALLPGATKQEILTVMGGKARGKAVVAVSGDEVARAMDALTLPLGAEGAQTVIAFLDADDRLAELQIAYRPKIDTLYPTPADLAYELLERGYAAGVKTSRGLQRQSFTGQGLHFAVTRSERCLTLGGLVRIAPAKPRGASAVGRPLADFGPVRLDRAFESNRVRLARRQAGPELTIADEGVRRQLGAALDLPTPASVRLVREAGDDLIASAELSWPQADNASALERLLPSLWSAYGDGRVADVNEVDGAFLAFTWQDDVHQVQLRLPYNEQSPVLYVRNVQAPEQRAARVAAVAANEASDRRARLAAGKPDERLPRSPGIANETSLAALQLGQDKKAALAALPRGKAYPRTVGDDAAGVLLMTQPTSTATVWLRQIQVRFNGDRVSQIRLRYQPGPTAPRRGQTLLEQMSDARAGAPAVAPVPTWQGLWADLPEPGKVATYRWADDRTVRECRVDAGGFEVILHDRAAGDDLGRWQWLPTGVGGLRLGQTRKAVEAAGAQAVETTPDGASAYRGAKDGPYEMVLVWFSPAGGDEAVSRVLAVHRDRPGAEPNDAAAALGRAWGKGLTSLGFLRRELPGSGSMLGAYFWNDDRVRVKTWVEATDDGPRVMTDWRHWPVEAAR